MSGPLAGLRRGLAGLRWYARELSGEARWDAHVERCRREGVDPGDRRTFERSRDAHREHVTQGRCC